MTVWQTHREKNDVIKSWLNPQLTLTRQSFVTTAPGILKPWPSVMSTCSWSEHREQTTELRIQLDSLHWVTMVKSRRWAWNRSDSIHLEESLWDPDGICGSFLRQINPRASCLLLPQLAVMRPTGLIHWASPSLQSFPCPQQYLITLLAFQKKRFKSHVSLTKFLPVLYILICDFKCLYFTPTWLKTLKWAIGRFTINLYFNSSESV